MEEEERQITRMAELIFKLRQKCAQKDIFFLRESVVSTAEYGCLIQFFNNEKIGMKELGEKLDITPGGVTRIVTSLEGKGIVKRRISKEDRREIGVALTAKGRQLVRKIRRSSHDLHSEIIGRIEPRQREHVLMGMEQLVGAISDWLDAHVGGEG